MENIRCDVRYNVKCHVKIYKVTFWYIKIEMFLEHLMQMLLISNFFFHNLIILFLELMTSLS